MHRVRGAAGEVLARETGFPPDLSPRAPPSPPVSTLPKHPVLDVVVPAKKRPPLFNPPSGTACRAGSPERQVTYRRGTTLKSHTPPYKMGARSLNDDLAGLSPLRVSGKGTDTGRPSASAISWATASTSVWNAAASHAHSASGTS